MSLLLEEKSKRKLSLSEIAYRKLKDMILKMEIKPSEIIPEEKIVELVGGSRTPVREALRKLENEDLVKIFPYSRSEVAYFSDSDVTEIGIYRLALDLISCQLAIINGTEEDFKKLDEYAFQCWKGANEGNIFERIQCDTAFHLKIAETGRNREIYKQQIILYQKIHLIHISKYSGILDSLQQIRHHWDIVDGLRSRDSDKVRRLSIDHLKDFYNIPGEIVTYFSRKHTDDYF